MEKKKILLVEDDDGIIDVCSLRLESAGYNVLTAVAIKDGKRIYDEEKPDLVLCDHILPDGTSSVLLFYIRRKEEQTKQYTPFILFSCTDKEKINQSLKPDGFLPKPFESKDLCNIVEKHLKK